MLTDRNCAENVQVFRLSPEHPPNHACVAATCAPDWPAAYAAQEQRNQAVRRPHIKRGTDTAAHFVENQGDAQRIADMACHLKGKAVLALEKHRHNACLCAPDQLPDKRRPVFVQGFAGEDFGRCGNTAGGKTISEPPALNARARFCARSDWSEGLAASARNRPARHNRQAPAHGIKAR